MKKLTHYELDYRPLPTTDHGRFNDSYSNLGVFFVYEIALAMERACIVLCPEIEFRLVACYSTEN